MFEEELVSMSILNWIGLFWKEGRLVLELKAIVYKGKHLLIEQWR